MANKDMVVNKGSEGFQDLEVDKDTVIKEDTEANKEVLEASLA